MSHPYADIPDYRHWRRAPGAADPGNLDPVVATKFAITPEEPVASAGSCFAQHVSEHLRRCGLNSLVTEKAPDFVFPRLRQQLQYGVFTTRSGNVYTARQLRQLFDRAYGRFEPEAVAWEAGDELVDPFRPNVSRYVSESELLADRERHFAAVRAMVETLDIFVFTLGLTETWADRDGAVFPLAPGVAGGDFDATRHHLLTLGVDEVVDDMRAAIATIRTHNPAAKVILTVSPVPLMATALDRHVLTSTTHSKAILRVAAQTLADADPLIDYFPSYEIITAPHTRGSYYAEDAREVTPLGVAHVMRVFLKHYVGETTAETLAAKVAKGHARKKGGKRPGSVESAKHIIDAICDEDALRDVR
ncbi:GSCFA domain-containing protein [Acuticoccus mangrovi]|uniref:GSCFA domain-containing protein n=1 Tax=Acuticoccus mangrovi TaxID=2796142 RepID=A0A934MJR5_9HYPH|nr:GSCFA domain-containing protein [Acuticoccus mangrovi]MBJ3778586.1 GSCFA domain-containing protein [Acuticoccus mangrovi]